MVGGQFTRADLALAAELSYVSPRRKNHPVDRLSFEIPADIFPEREGQMHAIAWVERMYDRHRPPDRIP